MSKTIVLHLDKITQVSTSEGDIHKVIMKEEVYDETDVIIKLSLHFKREIPKAWMDLIGGDFDDTVRMVLGAKSQQTKLD